MQDRGICARQRCFRPTTDRPLIGSDIRPIKHCYCSSQVTSVIWSFLVKFSSSWQEFSWHSRPCRPSASQWGSKDETHHNFYWKYKCWFRLISVKTKAKTTRMPPNHQSSHHMMELTPEILHSSENPMHYCGDSDNPINPHNGNLLLTSDRQLWH